MRKRSESFYAKTSEEFSSLIKDRDKPSKITSLLSDEDDDLLGCRTKDQFYDDIDELGVEKPFQRPFTLEEDETDLVDRIANINLSLQEKDKEKFLTEIMKIYKHILKEKQPIKTESKKMSRSLTFDNINCMNIDFEVLKNLEDLASSSMSTSFNSLNSILTDPILSKNIECVDDTVKLIVVGDQQVGKTFLVNKLLNDNATKGNYLHTNSLIIKKKNIKLLGKRIKLELFDTNVSIINSDICKVYYKICSGVILILDPTRIESVYFIEKQLQSIIKTTSSTSFFLIVNLTFLQMEPSQMKELKKKFDESDKLIKVIAEKYDIKVHYINIDNLSLFKNQIRKFLSLTYIKKGLYVEKWKSPNRRKTLNKVNRNSVNLVKLKEDSNEILEY